MPFFIPDIWDLEGHTPSKSSGGIDYSQFKFNPFRGLADKSQAFADYAKRAGLNSGTSEYADAERAFYETKGWFPWMGKNKIAESVVSGRMQREAAQREQDRNIRFAKQGMSAYAEAQADAAGRMLPLQKELLGMQNDFAIQQIQHQFAGQSQLTDREINARFGVARLIGQQNRQNLLDQLGFQGREGEANRQLVREELQSNDRYRAQELAARREIAKMEQASREEDRKTMKRGQDFDFVSNNRATSANLISSALNRRFY